MPLDARLIAQIDLITNNLIADNEEPAAAYPPDWRARGFVEYLYRPATILTRLDRAEEVTAAIVTYLSGLIPGEGRVGRRDGLIAGLASIDLRPHPAAQLREGAVPFVLDAVDAALGRGIAKPDTVLYVASHPCPAKEPDPVPGARLGQTPTRTTPPGADVPTAAGRMSVAARGSR
jgi:hypothetical protein